LSAIVSSPMHAIFGIALVLTGLPVYAAFVHKIQTDEDRV
jgi:hypothetical protein